MITTKVDVRLSTSKVTVAVTITATERPNNKSAHQDGKGRVRKQRENRIRARTRKRVITQQAHTHKQATTNRRRTTKTGIKAAIITRTATIEITIIDTMSIAPTIEVAHEAPEIVTIKKRSKIVKKVSGDIGKPRANTKRTSVRTTAAVGIIPNRETNKAAKDI